jgi:hypothetical protein
LYIVREIMTAHGGHVDYRYEAPNVIFDVELPTLAGVRESDLSISASLPQR